jgi:hypothetical protein
MKNTFRMMSQMRKRGKRMREGEGSQAHQEEEISMNTRNHIH